MINKIVSIINIKGGVGKSTIAINLAGYLSKSGKVLLVDSDPQETVIEWNRKRNKNQEIKTNFTIPESSYTFDKLKDIIPKESKKYDTTIIDCPPENDKTLRASIVISDFTIIPITPSPFDIPSAKKTIDVIKEAINKNIATTKIRLLVSKKIVGTVIGEDIQKTLKIFKIPLFKTEICQRVALCEAGIRGHTIFEYEPKSKATEEFKKLGKEVTKWLSQN